MKRKVKVIMCACELNGVQWKLPISGVRKSKRGGICDTGCLAEGVKINRRSDLNDAWQYVSLFLKAPL